MRLDGVDLRQWDPERLRQHIAYLPQQPELFSGTIAANLRLANPLASDARLWQALKDAGADEDVRQLEHGLAHALRQGHELPTLLQYQLSLARLFLHPGKLVLCDGLPAHLMRGPVGAAFCGWVEGLRGERTVVVVSPQDKVLEMAALAVGLRVDEAPLVGPPAKVRRALAQQDFHSAPVNVQGGFSHAV